MPRYPIFQPWTRSNFSSGGFYDLRLTHRFESLYSSMVKAQSCVINQLGDTRSEIVGYYRFLQNERTSLEDILSFLTKSPGLEAISGRHVLVLGDTSEISLKNQQARLLDSSEIGVLSDNKTPGFFSHVNMAIDADDRRGYCLSDVQLWSRLKRTEKHHSESDSRSAEEKESWKWIQGLKHSVEVLQEAKHRTFIFDREADIKGLLLYPRDRHTDLIVRTHYNRTVWVDGHRISIQNYLNSLGTLGTYQIEVDEQDRKNLTKRTISIREARKAEMILRAGAIDLGKQVGSHPYWLVEAIESHESVPEGEKPIHWRLITSHKVETAEEALQIIKWYKLRWMIEQLFRVLKKQGFDVEGAQLEYASSIRKLCIISLFAAFDVMRLMLARDHLQPSQEMFSSEQQACLEKICQTLQGQTTKQKNPHPPESLSRAAWIIARLGGWKGYHSQRPPGPITFKRGLAKFHTYFEAWTIFSSE